MKILKGTIVMKLDPEVLQARRDAGADDAAIIHEAIDGFLSPYSPESRERISFQDCEIE